MVHLVAYLPEMLRIKPHDSEWQWYTHAQIQLLRANQQNPGQQIVPQVAMHPMAE